MDNIILLFGGDSCERDISIITACQLYENIDKSIHKVIPLYIFNGNIYKVDKMNVKDFISFKGKYKDIVTLSNGYIYYLHKRLTNRRVKIDCAVMATHGGKGENGVLTGYLEMNNIKYTQSNIYSSSLLMDKCYTKYILKELNIPYVEYVKIVKDDIIDYDKIENKLKYPMIVKPATLGSSIGISIVSNIDSLKEAIELAFYYDNKVIIEKALENFKEYNIAIFKDNDKLVVSDIEMPKVKDKMLDFNDKYMNSGKMNGGYREFPAKVSASIKKKIQNYAIMLYNALDMKGVVRFDYLMKDGIVYLNEVNTIPGSLAYYLFENKGISYKELIEKLIHQAVINSEKESNLITYYKSSVLDLTKFSNNKLIK